MVQIVGGVILNLKKKNNPDLRSCLLEEMLKTIRLQQPPLSLIHLVMLSAFNHLHSVPF